MKKSPLKRKHRLQPLSEKMLEQINDQMPVRIVLCTRAGGHPVTSETNVAFNNGVKGMLQTVTCFGGTCELCHRQAPQLEPHEKFLRSRGGKLSLANSLMVCRGCHIKEH